MFQKIYENHVDSIVARLLKSITKVVSKILDPILCSGNNLSKVSANS